jgi:hypothetical protein
LKNPTHSRAGGVAQVEQCLPSKRETLSSNSSITRKEGGRKRGREGGKEILEETGTT